jgi:hypothetical protein
MEIAYLKTYYFFIWGFSFIFHFYLLDDTTSFPAADIATIQ